MASIVVRETHQKSVEEVKSGIAAFEEMMGKYMIKVSWSGNKAALKGPVSGSIEITPDWIEVSIKLGMMAKAMGVDPTRLEGSIRKRLRAGLDG